MRLRLGTSFTVFFALSIVCAAAQDQASVTAEASANADRSFYEGKLTDHPEHLSGLWEASNGHGGAVGIQLILTTNIPADATTLDGTPQSWVHLELAVYERVGPTILFSERNFFSDSARGGSVRLEGDSLTLHFVPRVAGDLRVDLDLKRVPGDAWSGRFHRGSFDSQVTLRRPGALFQGKSSAIAGTWTFDNPDSGSTCLHIGETAPGQFMAWSDRHIHTNFRFGPNVRRQETAMQIYGDLVNVSSVGDGKFRIELGALTAMCCSHSFTAIPDESGQTMVGDFAIGPNQAPYTTNWKKMPGSSCLNEEPASAEAH